MIKAVVFITAMTLTMPAIADMWLNVGGLSKHFGEREQRFNEINNGFGIEVETKGITASAGVYRNSIDRSSRYALVEKLFLTRDRFGIGLSAGLVDGYYYRDGGFFPVILPMARWDGDTLGIRAIFIPPVDDRVVSAFALQFRIRIK